MHTRDRDPSYLGLTEMEQKVKGNAHAAAVVAYQQPNWDGGIPHRQQGTIQVSS